MLGATAQGLYWMFRSLERAETTTRVIEATLRVSFGDADMGRLEWESLISTWGLLDAWTTVHDQAPQAAQVSDIVDFLARSDANPSSLRASIAQAHANARRVRTALTRETFEATNSMASETFAMLREPTGLADLPETLAAIRRLLAAVHGAQSVTSMRNENFSFARLGTFTERGDSTARILGAKSVALTASEPADGWMENVHFDTLLRSVAAHRAFRWAHDGPATGPALAEFLILSRRMPRSLAFCCQKLIENIGHLSDDYGSEPPSAALAASLLDHCTHRAANRLIGDGLHDFLVTFVAGMGELSRQITVDYRFDY